MRVRGRPPRVARELVRAFSSWFQLVNVAEKVHRIRRRREYFQQDGDRPQPGGVEDALSATQGRRPESGARCWHCWRSCRSSRCCWRIPMESTRRTTLRRQQRMASLLLERDNATLAPHERRTLLERIRAEVSADWQTEEHPRERLTVADEREHAIFYLAEILYRIVPAFYQEIAAALGKLYGASPETLELPVIVRFGTWVGGDMESSSDVHAKSIRETLARSQHIICNATMTSASSWRRRCRRASRIGISAAVTRRIEEYRTLLPGAPGIAPSRHDRMPYRVLLGQIAERLHATYDGRSNGYQQPAQFRADIALIAQSLLANRGAHAGYFEVRRLLASHRHVRLSPGDARSARARLRCITPCWRRGWTIRSGHSAARSSGTRDWWRSSSATPGRPALSMRSAKRTLAVFDAITQSRHRYGADAIGLYIVSGAAQADDVLAPLVLARWAGAYDKSSGEVALDVAPQFDTRRDARALRHGHARAAAGRRLQAPPRGARPAADGADRIFRQQSGERHGGLALRRLPRTAAR